MTTECPRRSWQRLAGKIAPEILDAPRAVGDPRNSGAWPEVHERVVAYLEANVVGRPWANHLALIAAVLTARRLDVSTIRNTVGDFQTRFTAFFRDLGLQTMADWDAVRYLPAYLKGEVVVHDSQGTRMKFWQHYNGSTKRVQAWLETLPAPERAIYQPFALPIVPSGHVYGLIKASEVIRQQRATRKAETNAVVPQFAAIRAQAHLRYIRLVRLRQAYRDALRHLQQDDRSALPFSFSYTEGGDPDNGVPAQERLHFRIWDRRSFNLAHRDCYSPSTLARARQKQVCGAEGGSLFLEFVRAERLADDAPTEGFWFIELLQRGLLGHGPTFGTAEEIAVRQEWLRRWGYGQEGPTTYVAPFNAEVAGLLGRHVCAAGVPLRRRHLPPTRCGHLHNDGDAHE